MPLLGRSVSAAFTNPWSLEDEVEVSEDKDEVEVLFLRLIGNKSSSSSMTKSSTILLLMIEFAVICFNWALKSSVVLVNLSSKTWLLKLSECSPNKKVSSQQSQERSFAIYLKLPPISTWSTLLNTGFSLAKVNHMLWILTSDWSRRIRKAHTDATHFKYYKPENI